MAADHDTINRKIQTLQLLHREPKLKDTRTLMIELAGLGYKTTQRTIQRDLEALSTGFPLTCRDDTKPYGWAWKKTAKLELLSAMDPHAALVFRLVEQQLEESLPPATIDHLKPWFALARRNLETFSTSALKSWPSRVRVIPRAQPLTHPTVDPDVHRAVYEATFLGKQLKVLYRARSEQAPKEHTLHPHGLVIRGGVTNLVCTYYEYQDIRYLPLHRFASAEVLEDKRVGVKGFNLDDYLSTGAIGFQVSDKPLKLKLRVDPGVATTLEETPLGDDQKIVRKDGEVRISVTVPDTLTIRGWIFSYGELVEVLGPKKLRDQMRERAAKLSALYA